MKRKNLCNSCNNQKINWCDELKEHVMRGFYDCEELACDGRWGLEEAVLCLGIIRHLQSIRETTFIFYNKKKTRKAREDEWERMKKYF